MLDWGWELMKKIILLGIFSLLLTGCLKQTVNKPKETSKIEEFTGNLQEAMAKNLPMKCEWQQNQNSGSSYVKGKRMYMETVADGKKGFLIIKDNCTWIWGDGMVQGTKICNKTEPSVEPSKAQGVDWNMAYKCSPVMFGDDKFTPPSTVQFNDLEKLMQGLPSLPVTPPTEE